MALSACCSGIDLSGRQDMACATCHHPRFGYAGNRICRLASTGSARRVASFSRRSVSRSWRNSQTILNAVFNGISDNDAYEPSTAPMFWDLRARSLGAGARTVEDAGRMLATHTEANAIATVTTRLNAMSKSAGCLPARSTAARRLRAISSERRSRHSSVRSRRTTPRSTGTCAAQRMR